MAARFRSGASSSFSRSFAILATLVLQGLSLPWVVIRVLGLVQRDMSPCEESEARVLLLQAAIDFLSERRKSAEGEAERHLHDDLLHEYEHKTHGDCAVRPNGIMP